MGDERVQQVYSNLQKHRQMQEDICTQTRLLDGGDVDARVGANDEQGGVDFYFIVDTTVVRETAEDSGSDTGHSQTIWYRRTRSSKQQECCNAIYHSTKQRKQLDYVLMNSAMFKHCRHADTAGEIDMNSDHKAAIARSELRIDSKTQQRKRTATKKPNKRRRSEDSRVNWSEHTINDEGTRPRGQSHPTTMTPMRMQELDHAIKQLNKWQRCRHERCQRRDAQALQQKIKKTLAVIAHRSRQVRNHQRTGETL